MSLFRDGIKWGSNFYKRSLNPDSGYALHVLCGCVNMWLMGDVCMLLLEMMYVMKCTSMRGHWILIRVMHACFMRKCECMANGWCMHVIVKNDVCEEMHDQCMLFFLPKWAWHFLGMPMCKAQLAETPTLLDVGDHDYLMLAKPIEVPISGWKCFRTCELNETFLLKELSYWSGCGDW